MEDLQEQKEASKIVLDIQDTRRYFESQGGDAKSSKIADGQVRAKKSQRVDMKRVYTTVNMVLIF